MKRPLARLLGIRELIEDRARLDLERKSAEMRALGESAERQRQMAQGVRADAVQDLTAPGSMARDWHMTIADAEVIAGRRARLEALGEAAKPVVDRAREELVDRRRERRQAEMLQAAAARDEEKRQLRRDQNRTDDWFQSRPRTGKG
jgi:flagellar export protein FliJ